MFCSGPKFGTILYRLKALFMTFLENNVVGFFGAASASMKYGKVDDKTLTVS